MTWGCGRDYHDAPIRKEETDFSHLLEGMVGWQAATGHWNIVMACFIMYCKLQRVVELGVWKGGTTALLAHAVKETGGSYIGADINCADAAERMRKLGLDSHCTFLEGRTSETEGTYSSAPVVQYDGTPIDLLFIDAGHAKVEAKADWDRWTPWVKPGGWIFIDNTVSEVGVMDFLIELVGTESFKKEYQYLMCAHSFGMAIMQKRRADDMEFIQKRKLGQI